MRVFRALRHRPHYFIIFGLAFASLGTALLILTKAATVNADFNNDSTVNVLDLSILATNCSASQITFTYNIVSTSESGNCASGTNNKAATGFINQGASNLHISSGSAAVGHGDPADYPPNDIDGQARPIGVPDAGADEI